MNLLLLIIAANIEISFLIGMARNFFLENLNNTLGNALPVDQLLLFMQNIGMCE